MGASDLKGAPAIRPGLPWALVTPVEPQPPFFYEIDRANFVALPEKQFVSRKRSSLQPGFVEQKHRLFSAANRVQ
jgi:hypothetical protein